jgi:hypothetical protein
MAKKRSLIQRLPLAPVFGAMLGSAAAILVASTPQWLFDATVTSSGIGDVLSVAQPPLGIKARIIAIFLAFAGAALLGWLAGLGVERFLSGPRTPKAVAEDEDSLDLSEFVAQAPPVAAPRRPIFADRELGAPLMSDEALATGAVFAEPFPAFDPTLFEEEPKEDPLFASVATMPEIPEAEVVTFAPEMADDPALQAPLAVEEFDVQTAADDPDAVPGESSIAALIRRLEAGLARRNRPQPPQPGAPAAAEPMASHSDWMVRQSDAASFDEDETRALRTLRRMAG